MPYIGLASLCALAYGLFYSTVIYSDDWSWYFSSYLAQRLPWIRFMGERPLEDVFVKAIHVSIGPNLHFLYALQGLINFAVAVCCYRLVRKVTPRWFSAWSVAALLAVYPADFSHMWLSTHHLRIGFILVFIYAGLLWDHVRKGGWLRLFAGLLLFLFALGLYEGYLGIAMAWALLAVLIQWRLDGVRRWTGLSPIFLGFGFVVWKVLRTPKLTNYSLLSGADLSFSTLIMRLFSGLQVLLLGWTQVIKRVLGLPRVIPALCLLGVAVALGMLLSFLFCRRCGGPSSAEEKSDTERATRIRYLLWVLPVSAVLICAGYVPGIALHTPSLKGVMSRINLFASLGASLALVAGLHLVALRLSGKRGRASLLLRGGLLPLLIVAVATQAAVQYDARAAWEEQKSVWRALIAEAPDLAEGTTVVLGLPEFENLDRGSPWQRKPFTYPYEVKNGLHVLYESERLRGTFHYLHGEVSDVSFDESGLIEATYGVHVPYGDLLVGVYDPSTESLDIIDDLQDFAGLDAPALGYDPMRRIVRSEGRKYGWRWLVEADAHGAEPVLRIR